MARTHSEKTAAESKSIGFDYQYYFFLWKLLSLGTGESVGLEVKDDVHTELDSDKRIYYQVKHTIETKADGTAANLTESDIDLWKTLSNWALVTTDKHDQRDKKHEQLKFLEATSFVLASNKASSSKNAITKSIVELQEGTCTLLEALKAIRKLATTTKSDKLRGHIRTVLGLDDQVLEAFLSRINFELDEMDIIQKCKDAIKADKIPEQKIASVFEKLDSAIRSDNFIDIKNGQKILISFDDFYRKYRRHYDLARNGALTISEYVGVLPEKLDAQTFIKQLIEINDVEQDDIEELARLTCFKLKFQNNIDTWVQAGELTEDEVARFKKDGVDQWHNTHKRNFRRDPENESLHNDAALRVLDALRERKLSISEQALDTDISNGSFYELSDKPLIGWRNDWEKYKK
jgi:polyhydroxyalkanoate synthesis regulator phasin